MARKRPPIPFHAFYAPSVVNAFQELDVGVSLFEGTDWLALYERGEPRLLSFELEHGADTERFAYNVECITRARRGKTVVAEHAGFTDLFVPIPNEHRVEAVLVAGPIARAPAASAELLERWRALSGRQGHLADAEFSQYVAMTLSTLVLAGSHFTAFQQLLEALAQLMAARGNAASLQDEIVRLRSELVATRLAERTWREVRTFVDAHTGRILSSRHSVQRLRALGLQHPPEQLAVGLLGNRESNLDPVDALVRRDAYQRACVELARNENAVSGRVGNHGVMFLCSGKSRGSVESARHKLEELSQKASVLAERRFGLRAHWGFGASGTALSRQYQDALGFAESALSSGVRKASAALGSAVDTSLGRLRRELVALLAEKPETLPARFERYLEAVALRSGYRLERVQFAAEAAFERVTDAALKDGALDAHAFAALARTLEQAGAEASTVDELVGAYRRALEDLAQLAQKPTLGSRTASLRRAEKYIAQHYSETLSLAQVARAAGYSPKHLSKLFHERFGVTFENYVIQLRLERAKQLLSSTTLGLERIALLSGFSERHHFGTLFRRRVGETPGKYRTRSRATLPGALIRKTKARTTPALR